MVTSHLQLEKKMHARDARAHNVFLLVCLFETVQKLKLNNGPPFFFGLDFSTSINLNFHLSQMCLEAK